MGLPPHISNASAQSHGLAFVTVPLTSRSRYRSAVPVALQYAFRSTSSVCRVVRAFFADSVVPRAPPVGLGRQRIHRLQFWSASSMDTAISGAGDTAVGNGRYKDGFFNGDIRTMYGT